MVHTHKSSLLYFFCSTFFAVSLSLTGCQPQQEESVMDLDIDETEAVYFELIGQGSSAAFNTVMEQVVYEETVWDAFKLKMETVLPFSEIDFTQLMVAFVAVPHPSGGITMQIESAEIVDGELVIGYLVGVPGQDCRIIDTPSVPFQAVMLRRIEEIPVRFEHRTEEQQCTL